MRICIEIDEMLVTEAQKACGQATKEDTVAQELRLLMRKREEVGAAFGKYRWRGNLSRSRQGRWITP